MESLTAHTTIVTIPLSGIDDRYSRYRLINPQAERAMTTSLERYGQLNPVVVGEPMEEKYLLVV